MEKAKIGAIKIRIEKGSKPKVYTARGRFEEMDYVGSGTTKEEALRNLYSDVSSTLTYWRFMRDANSELLYNVEKQIKKLKTPIKR